VLDQFNLTGEDLRFYTLTDTAKQAFNLGHFDEARAYATQILRQAPQYPKDWNYGNAIYYGNFVLEESFLGRRRRRTAGEEREPSPGPSRRAPFYFPPLLDSCSVFGNSGVSRKAFNSGSALASSRE